MRHTTCLAQRNEARLTSITYAWLSLYANSAQRSKPYDDNLHCFKEIEIFLRFSAFSPGSSCH